MLPYPTKPLRSFLAICSIGHMRKALLLFWTMLKIFEKQGDLCKVGQERAWQEDQWFHNFI